MLPQTQTPQQPPIQFGGKYPFSRSRVASQRDQLNNNEFSTLKIGDHTFFVPLGGSIQRAIDKCGLVGGGIIELDAGTHNLTSLTLTFPVKCPIQMKGNNMTTTILDFGSTTGRIVLAGSGIYTTGTVTISSGVTVTGASTLWLSSGLVAGDQIFLDTRWYKIASIPANGTIILSEGYGGGALAGATYRAGSLVQDIEFNEMTIQNSTSTSGAIDGDDCRNVVIEDITFALNNKNGIMTNFSEWDSTRVVSASATSHGFTFNTGTFCTNRNFASVGNGGDAFVLTTVTAATFLFCAANGNTGNGFTVTSCPNVDFISAEANGNGAKGFEAVSGNSNIKFHGCDAMFNVSDNFKLTASSDECRFISCRAKSSVGGYGINIADSTDDNNIVSGCIILSNSAGQLNDSGTGTVINANVGV